MKNERLKLEDVLEQRAYWSTTNETWISDTELVYLDAEDSLMVYDIKSKWKTILASNASLVSLSLIEILYTWFLLIIVTV